MLKQFRRNDPTALENEFGFCAHQCRADLEHPVGGGQTERHAARFAQPCGSLASCPRQMIAKKAGVSVGLLYRYFPSKQAVIIALYEALQTSLRVLQPHRTALRALIPVLVGDPDDGVFAAGTAFSRLRVQHVFEAAVAGSADAPKPPLAVALGRLLYLVHLAVLLWWLLDKTPGQRATGALVRLTAQLLPSAALTLRLPPIRRLVIAIDELICEALFGSPATA
jgi:AcrR family transcriptional regulator